MTPQPTIAGTGLFAVDVVLRVDGSFAPPTLGGSAGNVLSILAALGWEATPVGVVGDDSAASTVRHHFANLGARTDLLLSRPERRTPVVFQRQTTRPEQSRDATHSFSFTCPVCGTRHRPTPESYSGSVHLSELPKASVFFMDCATAASVELAEHYHCQGSTVVFEPSSLGSSEELFGRALQAASIVKYAEDRITDLLRFPVRQETVEIQTLGATGLRFRIGSTQWRHLAAFSAPFIQDTAGAGDWCTAGLLYHHFTASSRHGSPSYPWLASHFERSLAFGQALAAVNCMTEGAQGLLQICRPREIVDVGNSLIGPTCRTHSEVNRVDRLLQEFANQMRSTISATTWSRYDCSVCSLP